MAAKKAPHRTPHPLPTAEGLSKPPRWPSQALCSRIAALFPPSPVTQDLHKTASEPGHWFLEFQSPQPSQMLCPRQARRQTALPSGPQTAGGKGTKSLGQWGATWPDLPWGLCPSCSLPRGSPQEGDVWLFSPRPLLCPALYNCFSAYICLMPPCPVLPMSHNDANGQKRTAALLKQDSAPQLLPSRQPDLLPLVLLGILGHACCNFSRFLRALWFCLHQFQTQNCWFLVHGRPSCCLPHCQVSSLCTSSRTLEFVQAENSTFGQGAG